MIRSLGIVKVSRVVPAGTGVDHIPIGPDGKPTDLDAYHAELVKLERALSWAGDDGHAQHDAYDKIAKKQKERDDLIDATRTAFLYTFVSTETRAGRRALQVQHGTESGVQGHIANHGYFCEGSRVCVDRSGSGTARARGRRSHGRHHSRIVPCES